MVDTSTKGTSQTPVNRVQARARKRNTPAPSAEPAPATGTNDRERVARELLASIAEHGVPNVAPATPESSHEGHDERGRFARGNRGGPGNPFARRVAQLRRTLCESITDEDIQAVSRKLLEQAREGDVAAARLLFSYTVGRPAPPVDPDTLDIQEWDIHRRTPANLQDFDNFIGGMPATFACKMATTMAPYLYAQAAHTYGTFLHMGDEAFASLKARADAHSQGLDEPDEPPAAPSTNAVNGARCSASPRPRTRQRASQPAHAAAPSGKPSSPASASASTGAGELCNAEAPAPPTQLPADERNTGSPLVPCHANREGGLGPPSTNDHDGAAASPAAPA
jgi:hypothetical protein